MPRKPGSKQALCANMSGVSLHAAVRFGADERQALEQLCRYITRPAQDRRARAVQRGRAGGLKLKTPWCDGTTHLVVSPQCTRHETKTVRPFKRNGNDWAIRRFIRCAS